MAKIQSWRTVLTLIAAITPVMAAGTQLGDILRRVQAKHEAVNAAVKDLTVVQTTEILPRKSGKKTGSLTGITLYKKGDRFRLDTAYPSTGSAPAPQKKQSIVIFDGRNTWLTSPGFGTSRLTKGETRQYQATRNWWETLPPDAFLERSEMINGTDCYVIRNPEKRELLFSRLWIDKKTLELVQAELQGEQHPTLMVFSDFRKVIDDFAYPYRTELLVDGRPVSVTAVKSIAVNTGLPDTLFIPEGVPGQGKRQ